MPKKDETLSLGNPVLVTCGCAESNFVPGPDLPVPAVTWLSGPCVSPAQREGRLPLANIFSSWGGLEVWASICQLNCGELGREVVPRKVWWLGGEGNSTGARQTQGQTPLTGRVVAVS